MLFEFRSTRPTLCRVIRAGLLASLAGFAVGCAWQDSVSTAGPNAADRPPEIKRCSLEQVQLRRALSRDPDVHGIATPFIIHSVASTRSDRGLRMGETIAFSPSDGAAGAATAWQFETLDGTGRAGALDSALTDGALIRLRPAAPALPDTVSASSTDATASLVILKADAPDQNRPSTCDAQIRDGDYVFIHTVNPNIWLGSIPGTAARPVADPAHANPDCAQDIEICRNDMTGNLVCAWVPACAR